MTKDEIQAAIIFINDKFDQDYIETEEYYHIFKYHGDTIRAALQSAQVKAETVDIAELKRELPEVFMASYHEAVGYNNAIDFVAKTYNITRKTK